MTDEEIIIKDGISVGMNWYKFNDTFYLVEGGKIVLQAPEVIFFKEYNSYVTPLLTIPGCNLYLNGINITLQSPANTINVFKDGIYTIPGSESETSGVASKISISLGFFGRYVLSPIFSKFV